MNKKIRFSVCEEELRVRVRVRALGREGGCSSTGRRKRECKVAWEAEGIEV